MKFTLFALSVLSLVFLSSAASFSCNLISLNYANFNEVTLNQPSSAALSLTNNGVSLESVTLNAQCPNGAVCSLDKSNFQINPGETVNTNFNFKTNTAGSFEVPLQINTLLQACTAMLSFKAINQAQPSQVSSSLDTLEVKFTGESPVNARPGDSVKYEFELKNKLGKKIFVALKNGVNPFKDSTFFEFNDVELQGKQTKTVAVRVVVPPGSPGGEFTATLVADAGDCCNQKLEFPVVINIHGPKISLDLLNGPSTQECLKLNRGETGVFNFSIRNNEEVNGPFKLIVENKEPKLLITTKTGTFSLNQNEQIDSSIVIKSTNTTTLDTYKYTLEGKYNQFTFLEREYCVETTGYSNIQISNADKYKLTRGTLEQVHFNVTNTGNAEDEFAFTLPAYARFTALELNSPKVKLAAFETKQLTLTLGTDLFAPLGEFKLPIRVDSKTYSQSKVFNLNFSFFSSSQPGISLVDLVIQDAQLKVTPEETKHFTFFASNFADEKLRNAQVTVSGIPSDWTSSEVIDLEAGESKQIAVSFTIPKGEKRSNIPIQLTLNAKTASGQDELITRDAVLLLPSSDLSFIVRSTTENRNFNGEVTSVVLNLVVTNNGQNTLTDLTPALLADENNYLLSFKSDQTQLVPGQSAEVTVTITPKTSISAANVELQFEAGEIQGESKTILLPAMSISTGNSMILKIIAIFLLLVGISYLLVKEQNQI